MHSSRVNGFIKRLHSLRTPGTKKFQLTFLNMTHYWCTNWRTTGCSFLVLYLHKAVIIPLLKNMLLYTRFDQVASFVWRLIPNQFMNFSLENGSHLNSKVKQYFDWLVSGWETTWEYPKQLTFSCCLRHMPFFPFWSSHVLLHFNWKKPCVSVSGNIKLDEASLVRISSHLCWNCETPFEWMDVQWQINHVHERGKFNRC